MNTKTSNEVAEESVRMKREIETKMSSRITVMLNCISASDPQIFERSDRVSSKKYFSRCVSM